jgi:hypothetical protein
MSILSLRSAVTTAGGTPTQYTHVGLLRELITAWGGTPSYWSVNELLRQAITTKGGTPTKFRQADLLRDLVTQLGGSPATYDSDALLAQIAPLSTGSAPVTLNASDKSAGSTLTNGSLTVTASSGSPASVRATRGVTTGKFYWEVRVDAIASAQWRIAVADSGASLSAFWWTDAHAAAYDANGGSLLFNGAGFSSLATAALGDIMAFAIDADNKKLWVAKNNVWMATVGSPGVSGGLSLTGIASPILPGFQGDNSGQATFRFTSGSFTYTPPSGFVAM